MYHTLSLFFSYLLYSRPCHFIESQENNFSGWLALNIVWQCIVFKRVCIFTWNFNHSITGPALFLIVNVRVMSSSKCTTEFNHTEHWGTPSVLKVSLAEMSQKLQACCWLPDPSGGQVGMGKEKGSSKVMGQHHRYSFLERQMQLQSRCLPNTYGKVGGRGFFFSLASMCNRNSCFLQEKHCGDEWLSTGKKTPKAWDYSTEICKQLLEVVLQNGIHRVCFLLQ